MSLHPPLPGRRDQIEAFWLDYQRACGVQVVEPGSTVVGDGGDEVSAVGFGDAALAEVSGVGFGHGTIRVRCF